VFAVEAFNGTIRLHTSSDAEDLDEVAESLYVLLAQLVDLEESFVHSH
jgi:hypothetical protein